MNIALCLWTSVSVTLFHHCSDFFQHTDSRTHTRHRKLEYCAVGSPLLKEIKFSPWIHLLSCSCHCQPTAAASQLLLCLLLQKQTEITHLYNLPYYLAHLYLVVSEFISSVTSLTGWWCDGLICGVVTFPQAHIKPWSLEGCTLWRWLWIMQKHGHLNVKCTSNIASLEVALQNN